MGRGLRGIAASVLRPPAWNKRFSVSARDGSRDEGHVPCNYPAEKAPERRHSESRGENAWGKRANEETHGTDEL